MKLLIAGDLVVTRSFNTNCISQELKDIFLSTDYNIVNLEAPITESGTRILKTGPHLKGHLKSTIELLRTLQIDLVTLANNHILDYDEKGVLDTLAICKEHGFSTVGAGKNKNEAASIFYLDSQEGEIAIINIAENEWASATEKSAGANGMDLIDNAKHIQEAKGKSDHVIVIVHGGHEYYNLPSPRMQKQYRFYIDNGADIVIGHHTHCVNGDEEYKGKQIYYSLGNFLFTKPSVYDDWYTGLVLELNISAGNITSELHPVKQNKSTFSLDIISGEEKDKLFQRLSVYRDIIKDRSRLSFEWNEYVKRQRNSYLRYWSPYSFINNRYFKWLLRKVNVSLINKKGLALYLNLMRCEAHSDMSKEVVGKYISK